MKQVVVIILFFAFFVFDVQAKVYVITSYSIHYTKLYDPSYKTNNDTDRPTANSEDRGDSKIEIENLIPCNTQIHDADHENYLLWR